MRTSSLKFDNNWRRMLLFTKESNADIYEPAEYIILNEKKLPGKIAEFCDKYSFEFGFDYDPYAFFLWPQNDDVSAKRVAEKINKKFAGSAQVVLKAPAVAHGLEFGEETIETDLGFE